MKKITIVWTSTLIILVAALTGVGFYYKSKNIDNITEEALKEKAEGYLNLYPGVYPSKGDTLKLTADELKTNGFDPKISEEGCDGYVIVTNGNAGFEFKAYVKCEDYTTEGYEEETTTE